MNLISSHCSQSLSLPWHWHFNISSRFSAFFWNSALSRFNSIPILFLHTTSWSIYHMVYPLTASSSHGVLSTSSATISTPPLRTWDTENWTLQWKMWKLNCTGFMLNITTLRDFSSFSVTQVLTARQKKMDVLTTHRSRIWGHHRASVRNLLTILQSAHQWKTS